MKLARQWHDDSTAADSSVEPNTVAPNSKDKNNHPFSGISPFKMAEVNLRKDREKFVLFKTILNARRHRKWMQQSILNTVIARRRLLLQVSSFILLLVSFNESQQQVPVLRSCRRFQRNLGWWNSVWNTYSEKRFKQTLRVSRGTFQFILNRIRHDLERDVVCEDPIPPDMRLAICLYRLGRGDYYFTIAEMSGVGVSTVAGITEDVCEAIINNLWNDSVVSHFPKNEQTFREKMLDMEQMWQFPCCWSAIDGCHISIKCPAGGLESSKEYHNFKNFYSIVLMGMVDAKYRFIWASCGYPGNSHDSIIMQSTTLWQDITQGEILPGIAKNVGGVDVPPLIVGDSAFPFQTWLMKPYTNAVLTEKQKYFNYRLSRARMVTEGAYGQLKGQWRVLYRRNECNHKNVRTVTMACIVLHNICIDRGDSLSRKMDLTIDPATGERRDREVIRNLLQMTQGSPVRDTCHQATSIRNCLSEKLWREKEGHGVC